MKTRIALFGIVAALSEFMAFAAVRYVDVNGTNATPPFLDWSTAATNIQHAVDAAATGDEIVVNDGVYVGRVSTLNKALALRSVNGPQSTVINGGGTNNCVYLWWGSSLTGFTVTNGWEISGSGGGGVSSLSANAYLTNCTLIANRAGTGGGVNGCTLYNCVLTGNSASILGGGAAFSILYNCTLAGNSAGINHISGSGGGAEGCLLYNCTLITNSATVSGGGAHICTLYNCVLIGNYAGYLTYAGRGGGAAGCTLYSCMLNSNSAALYGGGASSDPDATDAASTLYNCTLVGNSARRGGAVWGSVSARSTLYNCTVAGNSASINGGGAYGATLHNTIIYSNTATNGMNYDAEGRTTLNYCCTVPLPTNGIGNVASDPLFVDFANHDFRLQSNSPCINAGNNWTLTNRQFQYLGPAGGYGYVWFTNLFDLDGNPRIVSGTVDIGAYEFQGSGSQISYAWLQQHGWPTDCSADFIDPDADGQNNWQEWKADTIPTNTLSVLQMTAVSNAASGLNVSWQSVATRNYFLERATNLAGAPPFTLLATNLAGLAGTTTFTDTNTVGPGPFFYRVGVGN